MYAYELSMNMQTEMDVDLHKSRPASHTLARVGRVCACACIQVVPIPYQNASMTALIVQGGTNSKRGNVKGVT